jgi:catalase
MDPKTAVAELIATFTTEMVARFSTVGGEIGSADVERDPRGSVTITTT